MNNEDAASDTRIRKNDCVSRIVRILPILIAAIANVSLLGQQAPATQAPIASESEVVELEEFVVEGFLLGKARAQDIQMRSINLVNVVSSDAMGTFPDINAAEALARLPGINLSRSDGEGRFITIRGAKPNFNGVLMNGFTTPSGDRSERRVDLQTVPNALIERIEVTKAATPDLPAEGIGGVTNVIFRNPADIDRQEGQFSIDYGVQEYDGHDFNTSLQYSDFVGSDKTIAFVFSVNYRKAPRSTYEFSTDSWEEASPGVWYPTETEIAWDDLVRTRKGYDLSVGWKPTDKTKIQFRYFYSHFDEKEHQHRLAAEDIAPASASSLSASGGLVTAAFNREFFFQYWNQSLEGMSAVGSHEFSDTLKLDAGIARQTNIEYYPFDRGYQGSAKDVPGMLQLNILPEYGYLAPGDSASEAGYDGSFIRIHRFDNATNRRDREIETATYANLASTHELAGDSSIEWKVGFYGRFRDKDVDRSRTRETQKSGSNLNFGDLFGGVNNNVGDLGIPYGDYEDNDGFNEVIAKYNVSNFTTTVLEIPGFSPGDYLASEDVYAYYGQGTYKAGKFTAIGGVRFEKTKVSLLKFDNENSLQRIDADYNHTMPSLHLRYEVTPNVVVRASWSNTVGRHDTGDRIFGNISINRSAKTITVPNPGLEPLESENYDASVDWYSGPLGLFSIGYFHKDIENFPLATSEMVTFENDTYTKNTVRAGVTGKIKGWEATFNRKFDSLPHPFNGLGVDINYASIDSEIATATRPDHPRIDQQPDWILNASLYYAYKKFYMRIALSDTSSMITRNGTNATNPARDRIDAEYKQFDMTFSYNLTDNVQLYGEWRNFTSERPANYYNISHLPRTYKLNGATAGVGVRLHF